MGAEVKVLPSAGEETVSGGGVLSIFRVTLVDTEVPALSVTVPVTT
jgi:hypothetical protein